MNAQLMEELLYERENEALDFKRDQYPFVGATNDEKSELIKDILAFANSWRQSDAYILIGAEEPKGGRGAVVGVTTHLKDNDLQELVNKKTNRPLAFSYEVFAFEGVELGVIAVPRQERPFFLKADFGKLKKNVVYLRRGSSTAEADPDEVLRMGAARVAERQVPTLAVQFAESHNRKELGTHVNLRSVLVADLEPQREGPPAPFQLSWKPPEGLLAAAGINEKYREEKERYVKLTSPLNPLSFAVTNTGEVTAEDLRIEAKITASERLLIRDFYRYPDEPSYYQPSLRSLPSRKLQVPDITVRKYQNDFHVTARIPKVQPGKTGWCHSCFYLGAKEDVELALEAVVSADNLPTPLRVPLTVKVTTSRRPLTHEDLLPPKRLRGDA
jgi:hypothetical protein